MRSSNLFVLLSCLALHASAYFLVSQPTSGAQWKNGETNVVTWTKGVNDGITAFDLELARLGDDGLIYVARDVPCSKSSTPAINIALVDIPPADDYFILFLNSTPGTVFATSDRFSILSSSSSSSSSDSSASASASPDPSAPTVTVSGSPNPTKAFVTTFPANGALSLTASLPLTRESLLGLGAVLVSTVFGAVWTIW